MNWISVEDRLPDNSIDLILYNQDGDIFIGYYDHFKLFFSSDLVTHWMPLPNPPEL